LQQLIGFRLRKKVLIYFILVLLILNLSILFLGHLHKTQDNLNAPQNKNNLQDLDNFGFIIIYNVSLNKLNAEIGENISISTVYSTLCNENYQLEYGRIGINKATWFEYKNSLIDGVMYHNITEIISINPAHFDSLDNCKGKVELKIIDMFDSENFMIYQNYSTEYLEIVKAKLNYSIIEQNPLTIFSKDIVNLSFLIYNEHTTHYPFSDRIDIKITNGQKSLNYSKNAESNGHLNITFNCSLIGIGNYTIQLKNVETPDYESSVFNFSIEVLDENTCINCSLINDGDVYVNVIYDNSKYSKAFYMIQSGFDANINWQSSFGNGSFLKIGDQYSTNISAPNETGIYQIHFIAQPIAKGKQIEFDQPLYVKRRPIELYVNFFRNLNQSNLVCQVSIVDNLTKYRINTNLTLEIFVEYNASNRAYGFIESNSSGIAIFNWDIPIRIIEDYVTFKFILNDTLTYQSSSLIKNITVTKLEYLGLFQGYSASNISIIAKLSNINGNEFPNQTITLKINNELINLKTNVNGEIYYSFIAPSQSAILKIEIQFMGSENTVSAYTTFNIEIKLNFLQQIWNSIGFILAGVSIVIILLIYLKKRVIGQNLATLNVD